MDLRPDGVTIDTGKDQWEDERFGDLARRVQAAAREVTDIYDPRRLNLPIFFQQMSASEQARRQQRNRIHVGVFCPTTKHERASTQPSPTSPR